MKTLNLIFPNQLFESSPLLENGFPVYIVEEFLFFKQFNFHQQKIAYHRATMKHYEAFVASKNIEVSYIEAIEKVSDIRELIPFLKSKGISSTIDIDGDDFDDSADNCPTTYGTSTLGRVGCLDSDGDGILDNIEKGSGANPVDTDGDGTTEDYTVSSETTTTFNVTDANGCDYDLVLT